MLVATAVFAALGDFASDDPAIAEAPGAFEGRFLVVSDADMAATAYADGRLERLAAHDAIALVSEGAVVGSAPASNSVVSWPQIVEVSADGRFAFVVETRGPAPEGVDRYGNVAADLAVGTRLSIFAVEPAGPRWVESRDGIGQNLKSVNYLRGAHALAIVSQTRGAELVIARLAEHGAIASVNAFPLRMPLREDDEERSINAIHVAPDGRTFAANVANRRVQFYRLRFDDSWAPLGADPLGAPSPDLGRRLSVGDWTPDGRFFLIADTNGGGAGPRMLIQGPGSVIALRPPVGAGVPEIASRAAVGRFPEGMSVSPAGDRVATVNMERTYLPELAPLTFWPGRRQYSVSLLSLDAETGALEEVDRVRQAGLLPENVIFDASGRNLAVAVFHRRRGADRRRGFVDFFSIADGTRLSSQRVTQPVVRGAHDLARVPQPAPAGASSAHQLNR